VIDGIDVDLSAEQEELARVVTRFCAANRDAPIEAVMAGLNELGVLTLGTLEGGGGAREVAVAMAVLGRFAVEGQLVPEPERAHIAIAAYLAGAAGALLDGAASYAADRRQFGRPIGEFQAVAFPLVDAHVRRIAASQLVWHAAGSIDHADRDDNGTSDGDRGTAAVVARLSARRAALLAVHTCHQVYGALSYTMESPMGALRRQVATYVLLPPSPTELSASVVLAGGYDSDAMIR
jgi:hypothetical protein